MAKVSKLTGRKITLRPTQGGHQKNKTATIVYETPKRVTVEVEDRIGLVTFQKSNGTAVSAYDRKFPNYVIDNVATALA